MKPCTTLLAAVWLAWIGSLAAAADEPVDVLPAMSPIVVPGAQQFDITAKSGAVYRISLAAPVGAAPAAGWPVIYLTDGNSQFLPLLLAAQRQSREGLSAVVVGIGYPTEDRAVISSRRSWDLTPATDPAWIEKFGRGTVAEKTGGRDEFLAFLEEELKPVIGRKYPLNLQQQTLFGHSFGGLFALHVLFHRPAAFQTYLVTSPSLWWNGRSTVADAEEFLKSAAQKPISARVLFMVGELEETSRGVPPERAKVLAERQMVTAARTLSERFSAAGVAGLTSEFRELAEEDHGSVVLPAVHQGVRFALAIAKEPAGKGSVAKGASSKEGTGREANIAP